MSADRIKVCLLNDSFPPQIDGVANAVVNYAEIIQRSYGEAIVAVPKLPKAKDCWPFRVLRYPSLDTTSLFGYRAGLPISVPVIKAITEEQPDIIHTHCPIASTILARALRETTGAPIVLTYHTKFDIDIAYAIKSQLIQKKAIDALVANIEACDDVWVVSKGAGENLRALGYTGKYTVMENGVDVPLGRMPQECTDRLSEEYSLPEGVPLYIFVGRMMWYKGQKLTLDALKMMKERGRDFRMVFIGDGGDMQEIEAYAASLALDDRCIFTGAIHDRELLRSWLCRANLFLFPSTFDTNGIVVREAAACSLASVLIKGSCAAEGVTDGQNGLLIDFTPESMAELLIKRGHDIHYLAQLGQRAADELYIPWERSVANAVEHYGQVLERHSAGEPSERVSAPGDELFAMLGELHTGLERVRSGYKQTKERLQQFYNERLDRYL